MVFAAAAVGAGAAVSIAGGAVFTVSSLALATAIAVGLNLVIAIGLSFLARALISKPKRASQGTLAEQKPRTFQTQDPIATRELVFGELRKSGVLLMFDVTEDTKFLHMIIALAAHECESIDTVFINDIPVYDDQMDADGNVLSGTFEDKVRIRKNLGSVTQLADPFIIGQFSQTNENFRLREICYLYVRAEFDQDIFNNVPNLSVWLKGAKPPDIRDSGSPLQWTTNPALIWRYYVGRETEKGGAGFDLTNEVNDTQVITAANINDQMVTTETVAQVVVTVDVTNDLVVISDSDVIKFQTGDRVDVTSTGTVPGGLGNNVFAIPTKRFRSVDNDLEMQFAATYDDALAGTAITITSAGTGNIQVAKNAEPRYTCSGVADTDVEPGDTIEQLVLSMAGLTAHIGDTWQIFSGAYVAPTLPLTEDDIIGEFKTQSKHPRRDRFNAVKGTYASQLNLGVNSDYPAVESATFLAEDNNIRVFLDLDLPFTSRPHTAQRIAKIILQKHRQQITVQTTTNLYGLRFQPTDTINVNRPLLGWTNKPFEVQSWKFSDLGGSDEEGAGDLPPTPLLGVELVLRETASNVYDWSSNEETFVDVAPNTSLPSPFIVPPPTGISLSTDFATDENGNRSAKIKIRWNTFTNPFVAKQGRVVITFRRANLGLVFEPSFSVPANESEAYIPAVDFDGVYDIKLKTVNAVDQESVEVTFTNYTVGTTVGTQSALDYGENLTSVDTKRDYGFTTETVGDTLDFGVIG